MGYRQTHRCESCGLEATVSGGKDFGFYAETETRYCPRCQTLDDVCVSLRCKEMLPDLLPEGRVDDLLEAEAEFGLCPSCKRLGGQPWVSCAACPNCGGKVQAIECEFQQWI